MSIKIVKLTERDQFFAQQFIKQLHVEDETPDAEMPAGKYINSLLADENFHVFVAVDGDTVAGGLSAYELPMLARQEREMFLYDIEVTEAYRQQGIARALIDELKKVALDRGIKIIFVGTAQDSKPAIKLYEATGGEMEVIPWFTYHLDGA